VARRRVGYVALALTVLLAAAGCGAEAPQSVPAGVDELVIPTPSPDPTDFVRGVDNPWLPLAPGATWRYRVSASTPGTLVVTVEDTTYDIAGVATTPVGRTEPTGERVVDYFAQDRKGNVWWFGREGVWRAGDGGAEAGLAMPATPRVGDGWRAAYGPGLVDVRVTVESNDQSASAPAGRFRELLGIDVTDALAPGGERRLFFARGVGLVEELSAQGPTYLAELESSPGGDGS
jgi:hypothetical protein